MFQEYHYQLLCYHTYYDLYIDYRVQDKHVLSEDRIKKRGQHTTKYNTNALIK